MPSPALPPQRGLGQRSRRAASTSSPGALIIDGDEWEGGSSRKRPLTIKPASTVGTSVSLLPSTTPRSCSFPELSRLWGERRQMPKARSAQPRQAPATRTDGGGGGTSVRRGIAAASLAAPRGPSPLKHPHPKRFQHLTGRRGTHHPCCSVASSPSAPCTPGGATQGAGGTPALRTVQTGPWGAAAIGHAGAAGAREPARSRSGAGGGGRGASWHRKPAHGEGVWERSWDQRGVGKAARGDVCPPGPIGAGRCTRCPIAPPTGETLQVPTGRGRAQHGAARPRSGVVGAQPPPPRAGPLADKGPPPTPLSRPRPSQRWGLGGGAGPRRRRS